MGPTLWCAIYQVAGENFTDNCHLLQKFVQTPQQLFCEFYKLVSHDECHCCSYELMMERMPTYQMQASTLPQDQVAGVVHGGYYRCGWE